MMLDALLALALVLTAASQLRPGESPIGPGEICLVVWLILALAREAVRGSPRLTPALSRMLIFWMLFISAEIVGTFTGWVIGDVHDPVEFMHDVMAYPLLAAFSCLSVVGLEAGARLHRVAWLVVILGAIFLAAQLPAACGLVDLPLAEPWYWDRFRGWSTNPNQLALFCTALVFMALHCADTASRPARLVTALACAIPPLWIGRLTQTDTFLLSLLAAMPFFAAMKSWIWLTSPELRMTARPRIAMIVLISGPLMLASLVPVGLSATADTEGAAMGLMKHGGTEASEEANLRFESWRQAVSRGLESGMLGLGPGPHLPIPPSLVIARVTEANDPDSAAHPAVNGTMNFEAHNTLLDVFTQGGLLGVASLVWLSARCLITAYRARLAGLVALICALCAFGTTGLIIRHPIFWFGIALCLTAEERGLLPVRRDYSPEHC